MRGNSLVKGAVLALAIVLLLLPIGTACAARAPTERPPIKIGLLTSYTGPFNIYGISQAAAIQMAVDDINAKGGILGRKLKILTRDDQVKPDEGIRMANELIVREKVNIIIGPISSAVALAVSGVAKENKVLYVSANPRTNALTFEKGHRYFVQMGSPTIVMARSAAIYISKQPWKKVFTIASDFEFGQSLMKDFVSHIKKLKPEVEIIGQSWPPLPAVDMSPYITQIIQAKPDVIYNATTGASLMSLIKQGKGFGVFDKFPWVDSGTISVENRQGLGKEGIDGMFGVLSYDIAVDNPRNKAFVKAFREKTGNYPGHPAAMGYEAMYFFADAIKKAGTTDTEKVIAAYESGLTRDTVVGRVTIRPYDHQATWPEIQGIYKFVPEYPFPAFQPFAEQPPVDQVFHTVDEVKKARGQ